MTESTLPQTALPEKESLGASLDIFRADLEVMQRALGSAASCGFQASLPEVVGYVPEDERDLFDTVPASSMYGQSRLIKMQHGDRVLDGSSWWPAGLSGMLGIAEEDYYDLTDGVGIDREELAMVETAENDRKITKAGDMPRTEGAWHIDGPVLSKLNPGTRYDLKYIVTNRNTTLFYQGPASFRVRKKSGEIALNPRSLDRSVQLVAAPPYGIVRLSGVTIHAAPIFRANQERTFSRIGFEHPRRFKK